MSGKPGDMLSHYRLIEKIGEGGMGVVWKADDTVLDRPVAIKVLPPDVSRDEKRREMFFGEAKAASSLNDPRIVQIYEFGRERDLDYIVMEYIEGKPLNTMIQGRRLPPDKVVEIGLQVARALSRAHAKGLIHRDLKPANILVTPSGDVKVVDFGLATLYQHVDTTLLAEATTQDDVGDGERPRRLTGTIPYMSPEQVRLENLDSRSDIFSLGTVLYQMTTGQLPFQGATNSEVMQEILKTQPVPVHDLVAEVPLGLDRAISRAMAPRRGQRYQDAKDLAVDLRQLSQELETGRSPSWEELQTKLGRERRRARGLWTAAAALVVVFAAIVVWQWAPWTSVRLDPRKIQVLPLEVRGQERGTDFVGRAFAQALAVYLAEHEILRIPPVREGKALGTNSALKHARRAGAGCFITGTLTRSDTDVVVSVQLLDTEENRILWGTRQSIEEQDLASSAVALARDIASQLGASEPKTYGYPWHLTGSEEMASSVEFADAIVNLKRGNHRNGLQAADRLRERFPDQWEAYALSAFAAYVVWEQERTSENLLPLKNRIALLDSIDPQNPYSELIRAMVVAEGDYEVNVFHAAATRILSRGDLSGGFRAWILRNIADYKNISGNSDSAMVDLEEALRLDPLHPINYSVFFRILLSTGHLENATLRARQALALYPGSYRQRLWLAEVLFRQGAIDEAVELSEEVCDAEPTQRSCAFLAASLQRVGRHGDARRAATKAANLTSNHEGHHQLARYWLLAGDRDRALSNLRRSVELGICDLPPDVAYRKDPGFLSLQGDLEFEAIIAEAKRRARGSEPVVIDDPDPTGPS